MGVQGPVAGGGYYYYYYYYYYYHAELMSKLLAHYCGESQGQMSQRPRQL